MKKAVAFVAGGFVLTLATCCMFGLLPFVAFFSASATECGGLAAGGGSVQSDGKAFDIWTASEVDNARVIVAVGKEMKVPTYGIVIGLATAMQESHLYNNPGGDRDSAGLFQQRPSMGWGTWEQVTTPSYAARKFYSVLLNKQGPIYDFVNKRTVSSWQEAPVTVAAQWVQRSGFPMAYAKWEDEARALAAHLLGVADIAELGGGGPAAPCGVEQVASVPVGPGGWTQPIHGLRSIHVPYSGYHSGVDISPKIGTLIYAAGSGKVVYADCVSAAGTCDGDVSCSFSGCGYGWHVKIQHGTNLFTLYAHLRQRPLVATGATVVAGQQIGIVGQSGHATGPHLHFEVRTGSGGYGDVTDPVPFMRSVGAPLPPCCT